MGEFLSKGLTETTNVPPGSLYSLQGLSLDEPRNSRALPHGQLWKLPEPWRPPVQVPERFLKADLKNAFRRNEGRDKQLFLT